MKYLIRSSQRGAALAEFAISFPFLLLVFSGIGQIGRLYSQQTWVSNINYFATLVGSRSRVEVASESTINAFNRFYSDHTSNGNARTEQATTKYGYPQIDTAQMSIHLVSQADTQMLGINFVSYSKSAKHEIVGPLLVSNPDASAGKLSRFENEDASNSYWYDCSGNAVSSNPDAYCDFSS